MGYEIKKLRYTELSAGAEECDWQPKVCQMEAGCWDLLANQFCPC